MRLEVLFAVSLDVTKQTPPHIANLARDLYEALSKDRPDVLPPEAELITIEQLVTYFLQFEPDASSKSRINARRKAGLCWSAVTAYDHPAAKIARRCPDCRRYKWGPTRCVCSPCEHDAFEKDEFMLLRLEDMSLAGCVSAQRVMDFIDYLKTQDGAAA